MKPLILALAILGVVVALRLRKPAQEWQPDPGYLVWLRDIDPGADGGGW